MLDLATIIFPPLISDPRNCLGQGAWYENEVLVLIDVSVIVEFKFK